MSKSLDKFKVRYYAYKDNPSVSALSLSNIQLTKDVKKFADTHHMVIRAGNAYYPKNKKLRRDPTNWTTSGKKKTYTGRGY